MSYSDGSVRLSISLNITGNKGRSVPAQHVSRPSGRAFPTRHCCQGAAAKSSSRGRVTPTASASGQGAGPQVAEGGEAFFFISSTLYTEARLRFAYCGMHQFHIKISNFLNLYYLHTLLTDRKLASQEYCHTRRISTEESKKANSDVQRTPKIWHRNDKNHKRSHFRMVQSKNMPCIL